MVQVVRVYVLVLFSKVKLLGKTLAIVFREFHFIPLCGVLNIRELNIFDVPKTLLDVL